MNDAAYRLQAELGAAGDGGGDHARPGDQRSGQRNQGDVGKAGAQFVMLTLHEAPLADRRPADHEHHHAAGDLKRVELNPEDGAQYEISAGGNQDEDRQRRRRRFPRQFEVLPGGQPRVVSGKKHYLAGRVEQRKQIERVFQYLTQIVHRHIPDCFG